MSDRVLYEIDKKAFDPFWNESHHGWGVEVEMCDGRSEVSDGD